MIARPKSRPELVLVDGILVDGIQRAPGLRISDLLLFGALPLTCFGMVIDSMSACEGLLVGTRTGASVSVFACMLIANKCNKPALQQRPWCIAPGGTLALRVVRTHRAPQPTLVDDNLSSRTVDCRRKQIIFPMIPFGGASDPLRAQDDTCPSL